MHSQYIIVFNYKTLSNFNLLKNVAAISSLERQKAMVRNSKINRKC